ncbi:MAG: hypothetical protein LIP16_20540 [Clostridium sp.]|nr:hypothetical protein [Clostridium sp.]
MRNAAYAFGATHNYAIYINAIGKLYVARTLYSNMELGNIADSEELQRIEELSHTEQKEVLELIKRNDLERVGECLLAATRKQLSASGRKEQMAV